MSARVIETALESGPLVTSYLAGATPKGWYPAVPMGREAWTARCREISSGCGPWLGALRPALGDGAALLERVADGKGIVVTTGQQAGLFGGPWYTWLKALAALEFARHIEAQTGVAAAPVFWAATDDADFTEAATTVIGSPEGAQHLSLSQRPPDGVPMSAAVLGAEVAQLLENLRMSVGSLADPRAMEAAAAFQPGETVGGAFVAMLRALLEPLGIAVLDAAHPALDVAARPHLVAARARAAGVHEALVARGRELRAAGYAESVSTDRALSLVFAWENGADGIPRKRRLAIGEPEGATERAVRLSPNVLLRPVVERLLLPTCAYLGGPGELAYFAQVSAVAAALDAPLPLALPRWSGMILPGEIEETLGRLGLHTGDVRDPHAAEGRLARATLPESATAAIADLRAVIARDVGALNGVLPPAVLAGATGQLARRVDRLERRLVAAAKRREQGMLQRVASVRAVLYPFGKPQERALNAVPFLSKYGDELIGMLRAECAAHAVRLVGGAGAGA